MAYAVVMAGGNGTRLWPRVRKDSPKHLIVHGDETLLAKALERAHALVGKESVYVTTNENLLDTITANIPQELISKVYTEPAVRDTGPAIGLMAARIAAVDPAAVIAFLPADHVILDEQEFNKVLKAALKAAGTIDGLVIVGVPASEARTCYGYIKRGKTLYVEDNGLPVYKVERFREKPTSQRAEKYIRQNEYFWNSGIVVGRANLILELLNEHAPQLKPGLEKIALTVKTSHGEDAVREYYTALERIAFDYAVLEKSTKIHMVIGNFGWEDIGSWSSLAKVSTKDTDENVFAGRAISIDTSNCLIAAKDKLVASIGVSDLIVIDTEDVLFICNKARDQDVKTLLKRLRQVGWEHYL
ncbi:MAG: mannose-1-phosphate guanylyltransferase [Firmicutes bacterium]|nr:mannose-1-phosphate guanylyltransferase [Bacillota bacterium]